jgi:hypothetical protein
VTVTVVLEGDEIDLILQSLQYTKQAFEDYKYYPTREFQRAQVERAQSLSGKLRAARRLQSFAVVGDS